MKITLYIANVPSGAAADALNKLFSTFGFSADRSAERPLAVSSGDDFITVFAGRGVQTEIEKAFGRCAFGYGMRIAIHFDYSDGSVEGPVAAMVTWGDGPVAREGTYTAEVHSFRPVYTLRDVLRISRQGSAMIVGRDFPSFLLQMGDFETYRQLMGDNS